MFLEDALQFMMLAEVIGHSLALYKYDIVVKENPNVGNSCVTLPESVGARGEFGQFQSSEQHTHDCI